VHGGLRYLQDGDASRLVQSQRELRRLMRLAPELVRPLECTLDLTGRGLAFRLKLRAGLALYRAVSSVVARTVPDAPPVPGGPFPVWYDGMISDTEAFLFELLHAAVEQGEGRVAVRNHTAVEEWVERNGRIVAARVEGLGEIEIGAVLECTGPQREGLAVGLAMNVVVDRLPLVARGRAVGLRHPSDGRFVFVVPWGTRSIVGTYERAYPHDPREPLRIDPTWIEEFLGWLRPVHPELAALSGRPIHRLHAGLLPKDSAEEAGLSRRDRVEFEGSGRLRVLPVKYTTARAVAERAVLLARK
jgi:glycerol-3-phosphate dehydrogenase